MRGVFFCNYGVKWEAGVVSAMDCLMDDLDLSSPYVHQLDYVHQICHPVCPMVNGGFD